MKNSAVKIPESTKALEVGGLSLAHNLLKKAAVDIKSKGAKHVQAA
ncbi:hypothetical protein [Paenibacillus sp. SYP-B3998]|nr:hypothetical protein [Paenibacillus sp. SYP-B3998]